VGFFLGRRPDDQNFGTEGERLRSRAAPCIFYMATEAEQRHIIEVTTGLSSTDISEILPAVLYLGSAAGAGYKANLVRLDIKTIINVTKVFPNLFPGCFSYHKIGIDDTLAENIKQHFSRTNEIIDACRQRGERVLVHCMMGISRSSTIVIAYLMKAENKRLKDALEFTRSRRSQVCPNGSFLNQLVEYEKELFGSSSMDVPGFGLPPLSRAETEAKLRPLFKEYTEHKDMARFAADLKMALGAVDPRDLLRQLIQSRNRKPSSAGRETTEDTQNSNS